jgi:hypothetical protein
MSRQLINSASPCASGPPFQPAALLNAINTFFQLQIFLGGIMVEGSITGQIVFSPLATSAGTLRALPTANGAMTAGVSVIPTIGVSSAGVLSFYQLRTGIVGADYIPNDYNVTTNNVGWYQCL